MPGVHRHAPPCLPAHIVGRLDAEPADRLGVCEDLLVNVDVVGAEQPKVQALGVDALGIRARHGS